MSHHPKFGVKTFVVRLVTHQTRDTTEGHPCGARRSSGVLGRHEHGDSEASEDGEEGEADPSPSISTPFNALTSRRAAPPKRMWPLAAHGSGGSGRRGRWSSSVEALSLQPGVDLPERVPRSSRVSFVAGIYHRQ